jgi:signal peptidase I
VKRIAALGSDKLYVENGDVIRNGDTVSALSVAEDKRQSDFSTSMDGMSVPENEVFVLGDWRDKSNDSRFWGTVPIADIVGKITYIWYSKDASRIGMRVK